MRSAVSPTVGVPADHDALRLERARQEREVGVHGAAREDLVADGDDLDLHQRYGRGAGLSSRFAPIGDREAMPPDAVLPQLGGDVGPPPRPPVESASWNAAHSSYLAVADRARGTRSGRGSPGSTSASETNVSGS
jgi:hypothetical protein